MMYFWPVFLAFAVFYFLIQVSAYIILWSFLVLCWMCRLIGLAWGKLKTLRRDWIIYSR